MNIITRAKFPPVEFFIESTYVDIKGEERPCFNVTRKGCEFIANKLTGQKGTEFTAGYVNRFHELEENNVTNSLITALNTISESMIEMKTDINNRLSKLEEQSNKKKLPNKKYSRWKSNTFRKLKILLSFVNDNTDEQLTLPNIMYLIITETEDIYNIEINEYVDLYRCEFCIDSDIKVEVLDAINHYKDIRDMFSLTLDTIMEKLHIADNVGGIKARNIFDELAAKIEEK